MKPSEGHPTRLQALEMEVASSHGSQAVSRNWKGKKMCSRTPQRNAGLPTP